MTNDPFRRKYEVFISSTFKNLKLHRTRAMYAIVSEGHMATCLETWAIRNGPQLEVIQRAVQDSQFYVLILGHTYGSCPEGHEKSYTHMELDFAKTCYGNDHSHRILSFLLQDDLVKKKRAKLDRNTKEGALELQNEERYNRFRSEIEESGRWWKPFRTAGEIERDLAAFFSQDHPEVPGYVRESEDTKLIVQITTSNNVVKDVVQRVGRFTTVEERLSESPDKKRAMAQAFCELYHGPIQEERYDKVFLESGSTLTYLAEKLAPYLPNVQRLLANTAQSGRSPNGHMTVATNNALAFLDMWLCNGVVCRTEPDFPPAEEEKYGATYGELTGKGREPDYGLPNLSTDDPDSWKSVVRTSKTFLTGVNEPDRSLVLAAASGLQLSENITAISPNSVTDSNPNGTAYSFEPVLELVRECRGFHVGSSENKLLKRSLYLTKIPTIVFIHDQKIDCPIQVGKCHFLFDQGNTWDEFQESYPLSIWVACDRSTVSQTQDKLKKYLKGQWKFRCYGTGECPVIIGHNKAFRDACKVSSVDVYQ